MQVLTHDPLLPPTSRGTSPGTGPSPVGWSGVVEGLHTAPRSMIPTRSVESVLIVEGLGIEGDRYARRLGFLSERIEKRGDTPNRLVTFFEAETIEALQHDHKVWITPEDHRRNITTRGVPLNDLIGREFRVGEAVLFGTLATPCKHLDDLLGISLINLLANRAGLNAGVIRGGRVQLGDRIELL
jgi:MOSC domain-containing protein YiiM